MFRASAGPTVLPKTIRIGENSGGESLGEKNPHRFFSGITWGFAYSSYKVQGGNSYHTKASHWKQEACTNKTRKFVWSCLHNCFTRSSSSKHCTPVGHGHAPSPWPIIDPTLLWRRGSHLFRQQASAPTTSSHRSESWCWHPTIWQPLKGRDGWVFKIESETAAILASSKFYLCTNIWPSFSITWGLNGIDG